MERRLGFRPRFAAVETADYHAILGLVAAGLGVALVPRSVVERARRDDVATPLLVGPPIRRRIDVALPAGGYVPRVIGHVVDALMAAARDIGAQSDRTVLRT